MTGRRLIAAVKKPASICGVQLSLVGNRVELDAEIDACESGRPNEP